MVLSSAMLLESMGLLNEAQKVEAAVDASIKSGIVTQDIAEGKAAGTAQVGDWLAGWILRN